MTQHSARVREHEAAPQGAGEVARRRLLATMPVAERRLTLAGIPTSVLEGGNGQPVVLLHGPAGYAAHWLRIVPGLAAHHRVIIPDLPGHGASGGDDGPLDAERLLAWLGALIDATCDSPPALVGQLVGGAIAARFAAAHGDLISRLVLIDGFGLAPFQPQPAMGRAVAEFLAGPSEATHDALWQYCAFDLDVLRQGMGGSWEALKAYNVDRAGAPSVQASVGALMEAFALPAIPHDELARIAVPTTLVWGRHDRATALSVAEAASARYGWPLVVIEDSADDPSIERPEATLRALHAALDGDPRPHADHGADHGTGHSADRGADHGQTVAAWNRIAGGYDETVTPTHQWIAREGLRRAGLKPGMRFLDVAAGSGALSIPAARMGAEVLATDHSPVMVGLLAKRAQAEGLTVETVVMDGQALDLPDVSVDMAGSQFGVMLFPDMPQGIRELARVVKPGGRVLMIVLGDIRKVEFFAWFVSALRAVRPEFTGPPTDEPPLPFQLQDPERLRRELAAAGLRDVRVETATERMEFRTGQELWTWLIRSNPVAEAVLAALSLSDGERDRAAVALERMVRERAGRDEVAVLTTQIHIGIGTK